MKGNYLGRLAVTDALHPFLQELLPEAPTPGRPASFRVFRLGGAHEVYGYREKHSLSNFVCKFYGPRFVGDPGLAAMVARQEADNLALLRGFQLVGQPHHVVKPLGVRPDLGAVLARPDEAGDLLGWSHKWADDPLMWSGSQVWLHGDATPSNFLFGDEQDVCAIDLERLRRGDRAFDLGCVVGEVQHAFLVASGRKTSAEPYLGHFYRRYCNWAADPDIAFATLTARGPFYMGLTYLRIARNDYVHGAYRERLLRQAARLLRQLPHR